MGQYFSSIFNKTDDCRDTSAAFSTPTRTSNRQLNDPRSPTTSIDRTPIQVQGTPRREDESAKKSKEKVEGKRTLLQSIADEKRKRIGETTEAKKDHTE